MRKTLSIILSGVLMLSCLTACTGSPAASQTVYDADITVWYVDDGSPMWDNFLSLVADYNAGDGVKAKVTVTVKAFGSDPELIKALASAGSAAPSAVICGLDAAVSLSGSSIPIYTDTYFTSVNTSSLISEYLETGRVDGKLAAVPLAAAANVLMVNRSLAQKVPDYDKSIFDSLENVCAAAAKYEDATNDHFFTASSFTSLFNIALAQMGGEFHARKDQDISNDNYVYLYNLLAEAAYDGGVTVTDDDPAKLVAAGEMACAYVSTVQAMTALSGSDGAGIDFFPLPVVKDGAKLYTMELQDFVITAPDASQQAAAAGFMTWLLGSSHALTKDSGYFPAAESLSSSAISGSGTDSPVMKALASAVKKETSQGSLYFQPADSGRFALNTEFEASFRDTLENLN